MEQFASALLGPLGALAAALVAIIALATGKVVPSSRVTELRQERDYWRKLALSGTSLASRALDTRRRFPEDDDTEDDA